MAKKATIELTEDAWEKLYPPQHNHLDPEASWTTDDDPGCMYETFGKEFEYVCSVNLRRLWTILEDANGKWYLKNGLYRVNRIGYLVSKKLWPKGAEITVILDR